MVRFISEFNPLVNRHERWGCLSAPIKILVGLASLTSNDVSEARLVANISSGESIHQAAGLHTHYRSAPRGLSDRCWLLA